MVNRVRLTTYSSGLGCDKKMEHRVKPRFSGHLGSRKKGSESE